MNLYDFPKTVLSDEKTDILFQKNQLRIERIISTGHSSPPGFWYDQQEDEWVLLVEGEASIVYPHKESVILRAGDSLFLPAHEKHRVERTSVKPACVWLCVFYPPNEGKEMK